jgi:nitrate reductase cytochrome c-type subunit
MRRRAQLSSWLVIFVLPFFAPGAGANEKEMDDGIDVYFRDVELTALSDQGLEKYTDTEAGESKLFNRSFPDAPPQISHSVVDMFPITWDDNQCLECHHPDNVASEEDSPLPKSHFSRAVMGKGRKGESMVWVVEGYEEAKDVVGNRYDCSMCHTPQATNVDTPKSDFIRLKRRSKK